MITRAEIVRELNRLTLRYNLKWSDIASDANKAIYKINTYMGTTYPKISDYLINDDSTYTFNYRGHEIEIIPEEYFYTVIIPSIAMEVLSRDEEFTTIYNKYGVEVEEGLFNMFSKEFNRVPFMFRQNPDQGVFFPSDSAQGRILHNKNRHDLPAYKFRIHYHLNNDKVLLDTDFVDDLTAYEFGAKATVKDWSTKLLDSTGAYVYIFKGWTRGRRQVTEVDTYVPGSEITIRGDLHLYALWDKENVLNITEEGSVTIKSEYVASLTTLSIPEYINNILVRTIPSNFLSGTVKLLKVILPPSIKSISSDAFASDILEEVVISPSVRNLTIKGDAFAGTPNLNHIVIPTGVSTIEEGAFPIVNNKHMVIACRNLLKPAAWDDNWYVRGEDNPSANYTVEILWGYNG